ncbi:hypothetical protein KHA80_14405 [Anaerobacillus sp. HL2]|nr:hypothetical protein KHA80_14405 [Anaerobacillus sp. HL2]
MTTITQIHFKSFVGPKVKLGDEVYHLSTQMAGVIGRTDAEYDDIPYKSPSNRNLQANGAVTDDGTEVFLGLSKAII